MDPPARRVPASPQPGADLVEVLTVARDREGHLLTAGEHVVVDRILALPPEPLELYARLHARVGPVFRVGALPYSLDVAAAVDRLAADGLAHTRLPDARCLPAFDVEALRAAYRRLGLPAGGARPTLEARLAGARWVDEPVVEVGHRGLLHRLDRVYLQTPWADRSLLVAERLGNVRWARYTPTGGPGLWPDRRTLTTWERARAGAWSDPDEPLRLALRGPPAAGWSPWSRAVEAVLAGGPDADTLRALLAAGAPVRVPLVRALEAEGRVAEALAACAGPRDAAEGLALARTAGRLARRLGVRLPPAPPLAEARVRTFVIPPGPPERARPTWIVDGVARPVEAAMVALLRAAGREATHAENWLWTSLYALVFRDLYFLPVPGMLPTARRAGPLDVGTPGFAARRAEAVEARLRAVAAEGPGRFVAGWEGERLAGLADGDAAVRAAGSVPGPMAAAVLGRLAREGWDAGRGLPDLYLPPGPPVRLEGAVPAAVAGDALLAEIKGPTDALRDEQRIWHAHLRGAGISMELWILR